MNNEFYTQNRMLNWRKELVKDKFLQFKWKNCYCLEKMKVNITDICEIKYADAAFTMDKSYEEKLLHKRDVFKNVTKTKQALKIVMISAHGIKGKAYTEHISEIITLEDLFGE